MDDVKNIYNKSENIIKIFTLIINGITLTKSQLNISFVDILIRKDIYKICYSGTLNINFPIISSNISDDYIISDDLDEIYNVTYAFLNECEIIHDNNIISYDAYIDVCGKFALIKNEEHAKKLFETNNRPVIFIDENDNIKYYDKDHIYTYDNIKLNNPIFYYDQAHIVGIDINQENYPNLKGLCYIDNNTKYTEIAQAIFRLRKINLGQTINIYIENIKINTIEELLNLLKTNDENDKKNKESLLNYQTYKALIRREKYKVNKKIHPNFEVVKYYFNDSSNDELTTEEEEYIKLLDEELKKSIKTIKNYSSIKIDVDILSNIYENMNNSIDMDSQVMTITAYNKINHQIIQNLMNIINLNKFDLNIIKLCRGIINYDIKLLILQKINEYEIIYNLIYKINDMTMEIITDHEEETQNEENQKEEEDIEKEKQKIQININDNIKKITYPNIIMNYNYNDNIINDFSKFIFMRTYNYTIYYLPNIFSFNITGLVLVIININKLLLIPGHMIKVFLGLKPMINLQLQLIFNDNLNIDNYKNIIKELKECDIFKYINNKIEYKDINIKSNINIFNHILLIILLNYINLNDNSNDNNIIILEKISKIIEIIIQNNNITDIFHIINDSVKNKYFSSIFLRKYIQDSSHVFNDLIYNNMNFLYIKFDKYNNNINNINQIKYDYDKIERSNKDVFTLLEISKKK